MMNNEIQLIWQELQTDMATPAVMWQLAIILAAVVTAWLINGALRSYVMTKAPEHWKLAIGSINRVLFPLIFAGVCACLANSYCPVGSIQDCCDLQADCYLPWRRFV